MSVYRELLRPDRLRTIEHPFGWAPCRILANGTFARMSPFERQLYFMLALAADRRGISFYGDGRVQSTLGCSHEELRRARDALVARDVLDYDGRTYQLLSLSPDAMCTDSVAPATSHPSTTISGCTSRPITTNRSTMPTEQPTENGMPESVREILRKLFDR